MKTSYLPQVRVSNLLKRRVEECANKNEETVSEFIRKAVEERVKSEEENNKRR